MAERPILDLTTDDTRPTVTIDGIGYPLRTARDLTLQDFRYLERVSLRVGDLLTRSHALTKAEAHELETRLEEIAPVALEAPAAILAKLTAIQRVMVFKVFTELLTPTLIQAIRAIAPDQEAQAAIAAIRSHGPKLSPGSYASTAGLLKPGSRERRFRRPCGRASSSAACRCLH